MTTNPISCETFLERLPAFMEDDADDATRSAVERHAATCMDCGAVLADLRKVRADAARLPELAPSRDLWAGIAARIETPVLPLEAPQRRRPMWTHTAARAGLLAASLFAAAGIGYLVAARRITAAAPMVAEGPRAPAVVAATLTDSASATRDNTPDAESPVARRQPSRGAVPVARAPRPVGEAQLAVATVTADYDREIARLRALMEQRRNQLDPATVAVIEKNLKVIDAAIVDSRKAIAADPSSAFLIESLNQSLRTKVELMRTAAALPIRM